MAALATVADLGVRLVLDLTDDTRAAALLDDVSANVIGYTGQDFALHEDDEATVEVCCGKATLPHGPVVSIDSVVNADGDDVTFTWSGGRKVTGLYGTTADVTYTWGYSTVPADIVGIVCQIAGRAYGVTPIDAAAPAESLGGWSIGAAPPAAAAGAAGMLNDERAILDRYRFQQRGPIRQDVWAS